MIDDHWLERVETDPTTGVVIRSRIMIESVALGGFQVSYNLTARTIMCTLTLQRRDSAQEIVQWIDSVTIGLRN